MTDFAIETLNLSKSFGDTHAVNGLNLSINQGSIFGLIGENGAGKSTTFGMFGGWLRPSSGEAKILGTPLQNLHKLRGKIGFLPQDSLLPSQQRVEDLALYFCHLAGVPNNKAKEERDRILQLVNLQHAARNRIKELSHGMYKRLCLAQAIAGNPQLLFLDEPTAGLDPTQTLQVKAIIREHLQGATVVISSHQLEQLEKLCTHGAIIHEGKIVASGSMDELTGKNQQLKIELAPQTSIALEKLASALPQYSFSLNDRFLECLVPDGLSVEDAIHGTVSLIFADGGRILGIERGDSLESFYLATTQKS